MIQLHSFLETRMTLRVLMKRVTVLTCVFMISVLIPRSLADWVDEEKKKLADSLNADSEHLHEPLRPKMDEKNFFGTHHSQDLVSLSSEFAEIRNSRAFVDKTLFLYEWLNFRPKRWYVTAPPGFGKSALAKMAVQFLNASLEIVNGAIKFHDKYKTAAYELFQGTNIFKMKEFVEERFHKYAVIYIDLAPLSNTTEATFTEMDDFHSKDFHRYFKMVIKRMMNHYPSLLHHQGLSDAERRSFKGYLEEGMDPDVSPPKFWNSASFLLHLLKKYLELDVIVIIDNYDALCIPTMFGDFQRVQRPYLASYLINFSGMTASNALTTVLYLGSFNTIELMLKKPSQTAIHKKANQITHTPFSNERKLAQFFGLSKEEVAGILSKYSMEDHFKIVNDLLNGHAVLASSLTLFNTKSVLSYIESRNSSPSALVMPLTAEIMYLYRKMFESDWVSNVVTQCIYEDKTKIAIPAAVKISFASFTSITRITHLISNFTADRGMRDLSLEHATAFIIFLQFLGLISTSYEKFNVYSIRASSCSDAEIMNDYVYRSGSIQNSFNISAEDDLAMVAAVKGLALNNDSVQSLGEAISRIVKLKAPEAEHQLKSLIYVYSKKVATEHSEDYSMEAGITAPVVSDVKPTGGVKPDAAKRIDVVLLRRKQGIGIIIQSKLNSNATSVLNFMSNFGYFKIFDSDPRFSKLKIKDTILIAISVAPEKSVEIAAEVWHHNNKTTLNHVILTI
ncbi:uncharacterized protein [Bemisia tabaci]|uniref:uncharacterized protein isoform X1 n=1 Tax=Bemisia tabaci TaxID=7038 RepID=UPI003B27FFBA